MSCFSYQEFQKLDKLAIEEGAEMKPYNHTALEYISYCTSAEALSNQKGRSKANWR